MQKCEACSESVYRTRFQSSTGRWLGVDCKCAHGPQLMVDMDNPFRNEGELRLQHVHDDDGRPLRVTSMRQLEAAQSKYHFNHIPTNMDRGNWDSPKQQKFTTVSDRYKRRFAGR